MRYHEVASGLRMVLHGEDQDLLNLAKDGVIAQEDLDEQIGRAHV